MQHSTKRAFKAPFTAYKAVRVYYLANEAPDPNPKLFARLLGPSVRKVALWTIDHWTPEQVMLVVNVLIEVFAKNDHDPKDVRKKKFMNGGYDDDIIGAHHFPALVAAVEADDSMWWGRAEAKK